MIFGISIPVENTLHVVTAGHGTHEKVESVNQLVIIHLVLRTIFSIAVIRIIRASLSGSGFRLTVRHILPVQLGLVVVDCLAAAWCQDLRCLCCCNLLTPQGVFWLWQAVQLQGVSCQLSITYAHCSCVTPWCSLGSGAYSLSQHCMSCTRSAA